MFIPMFIPMFILCNYVQQICRLDQLDPMKSSRTMSKAQFLVEFRQQRERLLGAPWSKVLTRSAASRCASFLLLRQAWSKPLQVSTDESIAESHVGIDRDGQPNMF